MPSASRTVSLLSWSWPRMAVSFCSGDPLDSQIVPPPEELTLSCMCMCVCMRVHIHVHIHVEARFQGQMFPSISLYFIFLHAWGGTHMFKCVGVHVMQCVCTVCLCAQRPEVGPLVFLEHFPAYVLIQISRWNPVNQPAVWPACS